MKISNTKRAVLLPTTPFGPSTSLSPLFTTKPTGQGTGLRLGLSYDFVKAHGGELKVKTREGGGREFNVQLPI